MPLNYENFRSSTPEMNMSELGLGWNRVTIKRVTEVTDRMTSLTEPTKKDPSNYPWKDETPQVAVQFISKDGSAIRRFNLAGFKKFDELTAAEQKKATAEGEYAVSTETGCRIYDEKKIGDCRNILNNLFAACKRKKEDGSYEVLPEDSTFADLPGCELEIYMEDETWEGKIRRKVAPRFKKFSENVTQEQNATQDF